MVLSRSLAGANSGCSFKVDSYQRIAFSNSSWRRGKQRHLMWYNAPMMLVNSINIDGLLEKNVTVAVTIAI